MPGQDNAPARASKPEYVVMLETWRADGTFTRLKDAIAKREVVVIVRSSGAQQECIITGCAGHAGLGCHVEWLDQAAIDGKLYKYVKTEDLLAWNPGLRGET